MSPAEGRWVTISKLSQADEVGSATGHITMALRSGYVKRLAGTSGVD